MYQKRYIADKKTASNECFLVLITNDWKEESKLSKILG